MYVCVYNTHSYQYLCVCINHIMCFQYTCYEYIFLLHFFFFIIIFIICLGYNFILFYSVSFFYFLYMKYIKNKKTVFVPRMDDKQVSILMSSFFWGFRLSPVHVCWSLYDFFLFLLLLNPFILCTYESSVSVNCYTSQVVFICI